MKIKNGDELCNWAGCKKHPVPCPFMKFYEQFHRHSGITGTAQKNDEPRGSINVERFSNPYLLHPEDYETQQELFDAIKRWWIFKYRKKESTIKDRLRYARGTHRWYE